MVISGEEIMYTFQITNIVTVYLLFRTELHNLLNYYQTFNTLALVGLSFGHHVYMIC